MSDVTLSYKGSDILELSNSGSATLKTGGKYCEDDIELEYVKPSGGGSGLDIARLVAGTYSGCTVDSEGRISNNNTANLGTFPLTKPIPVTQGDVITLVVVNTARLYHSWGFYQDGVMIGSVQTGNIGSSYVTSFTVPATGTVDAIGLTFNQVYTVTNEKFVWMKNGVVILA